MKHNSPNRTKAKKDGSITLDREHYHKKEIESVINKKISYKTILSNRETLLNIKINFKSQKSKKDLLKILNKYYLTFSNIRINENIKASKEILQINLIEKSKNNYEIRTTLDNVYFPVWYCFELIKRQNLD